MSGTLIAAILVTRAIAIFGLLPLMTLWVKRKTDDPTKKILFWASTRGAVTVTLAVKTIHATGLIKQIN